MAANDATCPLCGKPLIGRDRFEGKCAACREKEILGEPAPTEGRAEEGRADTDCPACGAPNPAGQSACAKCGAPLLPRRSPFPLLCLLVLAVAALIVAVAFFAASPRGRAGRPRQVPRTQTLVVPPVAAPPATPTREQQQPDTTTASRVQQETRELLTLLAARDYERILDNYCQPDEATFGRVETLLDQLLRGDAAEGFSRWSALLIRLGRDKAVELLRRAGDPYPDYTADLLQHLAREPNASGTHRSAEDRARDVLRWHIAGLFEGLDLGKAEIRPEVQGEGVLTVAIECGGRSAAPRPGDDPRRIRWGKLPAGWVVKLALADRLEGVRDTLQRPVPDASPPAR